MRKRYDVVKDATRLVCSHLELLHALYEANQALDEGRSRLVCRCGACRTHRKATLDWLNNLLSDDEATRARIARYPATSAIARRAQLP
jgi:hypothetical protein